MPRVSVIMPAHNAEDYLEKSIGSVLAQRFTDWELLIVDDGSDDGTALICDGMAQRDGRIRVFHQENRGVSEARNRALDEAGGEYIAFLDADDAYDRDFLITLVGLLESKAADCACCGHTLVYDDAPAENEAFPLAPGVYEGTELEDGIVFPLLTDRLSEGLFNGYIWRFLYKKGVIDEAGIRFSGAYLEDELFLIEYFCQPVRLAVSDRLLYRYYQNPNSATRRYMENFTGVFLHSLDRKKELVEAHSLRLPGWWTKNAAWAGLLMAIGNIYAPGNPASMKEKTAQVRRLRDFPEFKEAVSDYTPEGMNRRKTIVARLFSARLYGLLSLLYAFKNRDRG